MPVPAAWFALFLPPPLPFMVSLSNHLPPPPFMPALRQAQGRLCPTVYVHPTAPSSTTPFPRSVRPELVEVSVLSLPKEPVPNLPRETTCCPHRPRNFANRPPRKIRQSSPPPARRQKAPHRAPRVIPASAESLP